MTYIPRHWLAIAAIIANTAGAADDAQTAANGQLSWWPSLYTDSVPLPQVTSAQFTSIWQRLPSFDSPYSTPLSLNAKGDTAATYTYGVYLGWEPLHNLQLYLDIEQFQGGGISSATGLASLTDGDSIRSGSTGLSKDPYIARKVIRWMIPLAAETSTIERAQDQLPGDEANTRLEIKLGQMAVSDDFDKNRYANSTRSQFENWSLFNDSAWDFAADTRGYTGGLMMAWISPVWAARYGIYQMPKYANGQPLEWPITHANGQYGEVTWSQPKDNGAILRLLIFRNTANMGSYSDALAIAAATGAPPDVHADDAQGRHKYGASFNAEQPLADSGDTGVFLRAGWNDGKNESFAFTEQDRLVSFGGQLSGVHWGRSDDRLAAAYVVGNLSGPHERYLAAGGQGFVLGDGRLSYGQERVVESYYRFQPIRFVQVSPDVHYIVHPGFNRDRGPAVVYGLRVHLEY